MPERPQEQPDAGDKSTDTRLRIINAALEEFGLRGFAGARVDRIAQQAKANKQLIYYYFESKAGLYEAALAHLMSRTRDDNPHEVGEDLHDYIQALADPHRVDTMDWHRVWLWEALERGDKDIIQEEGRRRVWQWQVQRIARAQGEGLIDAKFDPEMLSLALLGVAIVPHLLPQITKLTAGDGHSDPAFRARQAELLDQLLAHLAPSQSAPKKPVRRPAKKPAPKRR